ncbi:hypothetical protein LSH36_281g03067 [Paralvinella palmiformis]|uniref:SOCS box domain-containing protein n=1 Tax=Paralvinella palmiformis TaxID=53620 RepID=A0AAD9JIM9_9ANNE|nr:hypothetical protein LSH36_281g03067 [Paralvinella palmiformis]
MGLIVTKLQHCTPGTTEKNTNQQRQLLPKYEKNVPWSIICNSNYLSWVKRDAARLLFDPGVYCITSQDFTLMHISAHGLHISVAEIIPEVHGCTKLILKERIPPVVHSVSLPYRLKLKTTKEVKAESAGLKPLQVCGFDKNLLILQALCKDHHLQFIVLDLYTHEYVGKYVVKWTWQPFLCECVISPDHSRFVIKPGMFYAAEHDDGNEYPYLKEIRIIHIRNGICRLEKTIRDSNCSNYVMAFDPRYDHSRLALANWTREEQPAQNEAICVMDLVHQKPVKCSYYMSGTHSSKNLVFSPDGSFLACLVCEPCFYQGVHNFSEILVYDADTLDVVKTIPCNNTQCVPLYPAILFPSFSKCGTRMAVGYGRDIDIMGAIFGQEIAFVDVYQVPTPINLQYLCRVAIRRIIPTERQLLTLPLPKPLIRYLSFGPILA